MSARYVQPLRIVVQQCFLIFFFWLGIRFYLFVDAVVAGVHAPPVRPAGVDGFLPIAGLLGTVSWLKGNGINEIHPAAVIIFVTVVGVSFIMRRAFCSWICPVATFSEVVWKGGFRATKRSLRVPRWLDRTLRSVKYLLLGLFIYVTAFSMSADALITFINSDYHKIADVRLLEFFLKISPLALSIILGLLAVSLVLRNPFCRYLCPYGALLGLAAWLSPLRVTRDSECCVSCGVCSQVCPTYIDIMHQTDVASPECIGCWRCISHCRFNEALSMRLVRKFKISGLLFAIVLLVLFLGGSIWGKQSGHWQSAIPLAEYTRLLAK